VHPLLCKVTSGRTASPKMEVPLVQNHKRNVEVRIQRQVRVLVIHVEFYQVPVPRLRARGIHSEAGPCADDPGKVHTTMEVPS
jgi:hypothetical protein